MARAPDRPARCLGSHPGRRNRLVSSPVRFCPNGGASDHLAGLLALLTVGAASVSAEVQQYDGLMSFPQIGGPSDPEEFSWEVKLGKGQRLRSIDSQHARVEYAEDGTVSSFIQAEPAHDAEGSTVPTSLSVSGEDVITLIVHHREGNPSAGGAPFVYPVDSGPPPGRGGESVVVSGPRDEAESGEDRGGGPAAEPEAVDGAASGCVVPRLTGRTLRASKRRLRKAGCRVGRVRRRGGVTFRTGRVVRQRPRPGAVLAQGRTVRLTLGGAARFQRHHARHGR